MVDGFVKTFYQPYLVIPVKTGIPYANTLWIPASAGMTDLPIFYEIITVDNIQSNKVIPMSL
jgi:hypothetical protein